MPLAQLGEAKVDQLCKLLVFREKNVFCLEVSMNYMEVVEVVQRLQTLLDHLGSFRLRKFRCEASVFRSDFLNWSTFKELCHYVQILMIQVNLTKFDNVWMIDSAQDC